jgi:hypothetical protein
VVYLGVAVGCDSRCERFDAPAVAAPEEPPHVHGTPAPPARIAERVQNGASHAVNSRSQSALLADGTGAPSSAPESRRPSLRYEIGASQLNRPAAVALLGSGLLGLAGLTRRRRAA